MENNVTIIIDNLSVDFNDADYYHNKMPLRNKKLITDYIHGMTIKDLHVKYKISELRVFQIILKYYRNRDIKKNMILNNDSSIMLKIAYLKKLAELKLVL